jgi:hypothetical protein
VARARFELLDALPAALKGLVLDFQWSHERLWSLDLPIHEVPAGSLRWLLGLPLWAHQGMPFTVTPLQVRANPTRYHAQYHRTMTSDLSYPLHVLASHGHIITIIDGYHRLLKADILGIQQVHTKHLPPTRLDAIA